MDVQREDLLRSPVALIYDERMCEHWDPEDEDHPETPERIRAIWKMLEFRGILERCAVLNAKEAEDRYLALVHTKKHINLIRNISTREYDSRRSRVAMSFNSIYFNDGSSEAAYLAAGSVIEVSERVAKGEFSSACAIVRPPGHHAEPDKPMGFCLFNNVAAAASYLLNERPELGIRKILIVDWDVHHGNGTQKMFWKDPRVLFFSIHRFDFGTFYPSGDDGSFSMVGEGLGAGYNINVPWEHGRCGDADYLAVWDHVLVPVARAYNPDIILISGGFDAAIGDPLGGCCITPYGYSLMMKKLMEFAGGKIVMALEGGYNLTSLANSVLACVEALLEDKPIVGSSEASPFESTWRLIRTVRKELSSFWPIFKEELAHKPGLRSTLVYDGEDKMIGTTVEPVGASCGAKLPEEDVQDIIEPLLKLKVNEDHQETKIVNDNITIHKDASLVPSAKYNIETLLPGGDLAISDNWRSIFSKINIWYGSYGSNVWKPRFLCYIKGGQVEGMQKPCIGSKDRSLPQEIKWKTVPHRLFFAHSYTRTWGTGGVAFIHPESNLADKAYICMYKITLEQFNDLLLQENALLLQKNGQSSGAESPLLDLLSLDFSVRNQSKHLETIKVGWYSNIVYLGTDCNLPILTMTCPLADIESLKSGKLRILPPSESYAKTLVNGLVEGKQLSVEEATDYIHSAAVRKL